MSSAAAPDWLPAGWTMRSKSNDFGKKVKCYVDPASGRKFYSKSQVFQHLENAKSEAGPEIAVCSVDDAITKANESPHWLPDGWIVEEKARNCGVAAGSKFKIYTEPKSGRKFYSKPEVSRYLEKVSSSSTPQRVVSAFNEVSSAITKANESPHWLPDGWIVEEKARNSGVAAGSKFKIYTELKSGRKFYSKPEVSRYLEKVSSSSTPQRVVSAVNEVSSAVKETEETKDMKDSSEWLPHGWIMESKTHNSGAKSGKKIKIFIDPASGCKFYSKLQVLRYLEKINSKSPEKSSGSANEHILDHSTQDGPSLEPDVSQNCKMNKHNISDEKKLHGGMDLMDNATFERVIDEKFPPGWMKEIRTRKNGDLKQKDQFYTDPVSGYTFRSKADALRFLETGDIKTCKCRPFKRDIGDLNLMNNDIPHKIDHSAGGRPFSKPDVSQDLASKSHKTNQSNISGHLPVVEPSMDNVVVAKKSSEDIPPGWTIEYKTRNVANRVVKDPYYVDPVGGYVFRSKPDVLRYLETGDINSCKMKPKKRDENDLVINHDISPPSAVEVKKLTTTSRRLFSGGKRDNLSPSKGSVLPEAGRSQRRRKSISDATMDFSSPTAEILEANRAKISEPTRKDSKIEQGINVSAANDIIFSVVNDILHEEEILGNEHSRGENILHEEKVLENEHSRGENILHEEKVLENEHSRGENILHEEKTLGNEHSRGKTRSSIKSNKRRAINLPLRSSKRLTALKIEKPPDNSVAEPSLEAAAGKGGETKVSPLSHINLNDSVFDVETQGEGEVADDGSTQKDTILNNQWSNGRGEKQVDQSITNLFEEQEPEEHNTKRAGKELVHQAYNSIEIASYVEQDNNEKGQHEAVPEHQIGTQEAEKHNDGILESRQTPIEYPFLDSWSDPCLEFAFKTLTGAIPVEDNLSFNDYFHQQAETSKTQNSGHVDQPEELPSFLQKNKVTSRSEVIEVVVPLQQVAPDSTSHASGKYSLPSFPSTSPQPSSAGAGNREWQAKVN